MSEKIQSDSETVHFKNENNVQNREMLDQDQILTDNDFPVKYPDKVVKKPVPKPRKNKLAEQRRDSSSSSGTFNVVSPKILFKRSSDKLNVTGDCTKVCDDESKIDSLDKIASYSDPSSTQTEDLKQVTSCKNNDSSDTTVEKSRTKQLKGKIQYSRPKSSVNISVKQDNITSPANSNAEEYNYETISEIIIHKSDRLLLNSFVIHPVVKIHIVDIRNGKYLKKSDTSRSVTFYYENDDNNYILPVISNSYNLQENRSFYPKWEESIILNEDFKYLVNKNVIIFFEIMDFSTSNIEILKKNKEYQKGWYKIAFAFLRPGGKDSPHIYKKLRLQLYYISNTQKNEPDYCELWELWDKKKLKKYRSSLYVTIKSMKSPMRVIESFRSKTPLQKEVVPDMEDRNDQSAVEQQLKKDTFDIERKLKGVNRKWKLLPEDFLSELDSFDNGCFVLKFSNNGQFLACSTHSEKEFYIIIYSVKDFEEKMRYECQEGLIYSIVWSHDDEYLLSASSDKTLLIWNVKSNIFQQILHHPSFVYTCDFNGKNVIATGSYDQIIRIWTLKHNSKKYELSEELDKHNGFVTSVCFTKTHPTFLYSADSQGQIYEWNYNSAKCTDNRLLDIIDLRGIKINQILLFPDKKRLLVHSRDSALRIISIQSSCVIYWLYGSLNLRIQTFCSISHKGLLVASGNENGLVLIWDANTGKVLKTLEGFSKEFKVVHCVDFNPRINMLALSHYGSKEPVLIYGSKENDTNNYDYSNNEHENTYISDEYNCLDYCDILRKMDSLLL